MDPSSEERSESLVRKALDLTDEDLIINAIAESKHKQWIDSLSDDNRIKQLYYATSDPWLIYHPLAGWIKGGPCDAEAALTKLGWPVILGDLAQEFNEVKMRDWQDRAKQLLEYYQNDQGILPNES